MNFNELLKKDYILTDGAMGTEIQRHIKTKVEFPAMLNFTECETVAKVIRSYAENGSDIVCANTFGINRIKLKNYGETVGDVIKQALTIAREACRGLDTLIALDVSPIGQMLEPSGTLGFEEAYDIYREIVSAGYRFGADLIIAETMTDLYELKAALLACKENTPLPVICSMSFEKNGRTFTGCSPSAMALTLEGLGADVVGVNCSLGPKELAGVVDEILYRSNVPVMVKPNAGLPDPETGTFSLSATDFASSMKQFAQKGVKLLGGCCGTSPEFIMRLKETIGGMQLSVVDRKPAPPAVCSHCAVVDIDRPRIIGERINPTGKKLFKEALKNSDYDYILKQAIEQVDAGAEILDVNVGLPETDEKRTMVKTIKLIQSVCDTPLQIDSTNPEVIEAALRVYNGKAIVNSVNGDDEILDAILPVVKKYGAAVVGLTLNKDGIPKRSSERFAIAEKILEKALSYGIKRENIFIDCLTLTASAEQEAVAETLEAVRMVKAKLGLKTVLGVSNISFGLPNRETVNHTFLTMALAAGLDLPIINPNVESMTGSVRAYSLLASYDKGSADFISAYSGTGVHKENIAKSDMTLEYAILNGLKNESAKIISKLLVNENPMDIVSERLIPILDRAGTDFESGKLFLPQLILTAETAGVCFDEVKKKLAETGEKPEFKGKVILATVKGDIHDIGKNIVKVLLESYGYHVIDLGKDVSEETVLEAAKKHNVKLIGLSALMTTTLPSMESTIIKLKSEIPDCKVMVGGAVLTREYAEKIGSDYYAPDAKGAVDIAKNVFC